MSLQWHRERGATRSQFLLIALSLVCLAVAFCAGALAGGLFGALVGELGVKQRRFAYEKKAVVSILASNPPFLQLEIWMYTGDGSAYLAGEVASKADYERLCADRQETA